MKTLSIIAIDGPSGVGKSTTAKQVALELDWSYLDTGGMYRAVAVALKRSGVRLEDRAALDRVLATLNIQQRRNTFFLNGEDISGVIRTPEMGQMASQVAMDGRVREVLVAQQRRIGASGGWVVDGRDVGTVVFPNACCKIFLTASPEARARRRMLELQAKGVKATLESILEDQTQRDLQDSTRAISPLRKAEDAVELDSSCMRMEEVVNWIVERHKRHSV